MNSENESETLSRYLYRLSDVKISFVDALLNKNYKEARWWFFEYYYSLNNDCDKAWQLLFQVYYDYFAIHYPKMETYIMKRYKMWKYGEKVEDFGGNIGDWNFIDIPTRDIWWPICVIKNLCTRKICGFDVFVLRQLMDSGDCKPKTYRFSKSGEKVKEDRKWLYDFKYDKALFPLLWAMHERDWPTICYWIVNDKFKDKDCELYENIIHYLKFVEKYELDIDAGVKKWKQYRMMYKNISHVILTLIVFCFKYPIDEGMPGTKRITEMVDTFNKMSMDEENVVFSVKEKEDTPDQFITPDGLVLQMIYITPPRSDIKEVLADNVCGSRLWEILAEKRKYGISSKNDCFKNGVVSTSQLLTDLRENWREKCYHCPLWNVRFRRFNAEMNDGKIIFPDEDKEESWNETYNLEPDEQSLDTQLKSVGREGEIIKQNNYRRWFIRKSVIDASTLLYDAEFEDGFPIM